jgi:hypothetical protein
MVLTALDDAGHGFDRQRMMSNSKWQGNDCEIANGYAARLA